MSETAWMWRRLRRRRKRGGNDQADHRQRQHRGVHAGEPAVEPLHAVTQPADQKRCPQHQQRVAEDRAGDGRTSDVDLPRVDGEDGDDQLGGVAEGRVEHAPTRGPTCRSARSRCPRSRRASAAPARPAGTAACWGRRPGRRRPATSASAAAAARLAISGPCQPPRHRALAPSSLTQAPISRNSPATQRAALGRRDRLQRLQLLGDRVGRPIRPPCHDRDGRLPGGSGTIASTTPSCRQASAVGRSAPAARRASPASFHRIAAQPSGEITV